MYYVYYSCHLLDVKPWHRINLLISQCATKLPHSFSLTLHSDTLSLSLCLSRCLSFCHYVSHSLPPPLQFRVLYRVFLVSAIFLLYFEDRSFTKAMSGTEIIFYFVKMWDFYGYLCTAYYVYKTLTWLFYTKFKISRSTDSIVADFYIFLGWGY